MSRCDTGRRGTRPRRKRRRRYGAQGFIRAWSGRTVHRRSGRHATAHGRRGPGASGRGATGLPGGGDSHRPGVSAPQGEDRGASAERNRGAETQETDAPLLGPEQEEFRSRWQRIQSEFVDDPRAAVGAADTLVAEVMQALATTFSEHKQGLEGQWHRGEEVATEELRVALQRYRSFFNRLLNT